MGNCAFSILSADLDMASMFLIYQLCICTLDSFDMKYKVKENTFYI